MRIPAPSLTRQNLLCATALGMVLLCGPFPRIQGIFHMMLVLALAPRPGAPLTGALWALAGGWAVEGTLRLYPHLGGTPWADLTLVLFAGWMAGRWPLEGARGWLIRLACLGVLLVFLTHGAVRMAAGPHAWGQGWLWALGSLPLWGWASWRLLYGAAAPIRL